ncbi:MAG: cache domain-containing protein [Spirochaetaceae bacterium]|jgi:hypothetical protein|nr:cache domain-containing protein [Spirochaetaceae bacterium]
MSAPKKAMLCLLITAIVVAGCALTAWTGLFGLIEASFYVPAINREAQHKLNSQTVVLSDFFSKLTTTFAQTLSADAAHRSFSVQQHQADIFERRRIFGELMTAIPALQWVRFIDMAGNRIHFSTEEAADLVIPAGTTTAAYRPWTEVPRFIPITPAMIVSDGGIIFDGDEERLVFYLPVNGIDGQRQGVALFSLAVRAIADQLLASGLIGIGEQISVISNPSGIIAGLRGAADGTLKNTIMQAWRDGVAERSVVHSEQASFALFTAKSREGFFTGILLSESLFEVPFALKMLILAVFGITLYIILFWCLNARQDPVTIVQHRMKRLQVNLLNEYFELKNDMDWRQWKRDLAQRREEMRDELLRGFSTNQRKRNEGVFKYIDSFFDKSWDELVGVIGNRSRSDIERLDEEKIEDILKRILKAASALSTRDRPPPPPPPHPSALPEAAAQPAKTQPVVAEPVEVEELLPALEPVEELIPEALPESPVPKEPAAPPQSENVFSTQNEPEELEELEDLEALPTTANPFTSSEDWEDDDDYFYDDFEDEDAPIELDENAWFEEALPQVEPFSVPSPSQAADPAPSPAPLPQTPAPDVSSSAAQTARQPPVQGTDKVLTQISASIMSEIARNARREQEDQNQNTKKQRLSTKGGAPASSNALDAPFLEEDPFQGIDSEEAETTLNSDDFSYGNFVTKLSGRRPERAPARSIRAATPVPAAAPPPSPTETPLPPPPVSAIPPAPPPPSTPPDAKKQAPVQAAGITEVFVDTLPPVENELYNVESFDEVTEDELQQVQAAALFTEPAKESTEPGANVNELAKRIEFAPENDSNWDHDFDMDMEISSPAEELFADVESPDVIKERGGVPYISTSGLVTKEEKKEDLDPNMKNLIDSVLTPPS